MDKIRQRVLRFLHLDHLADNPNSERYTYITDIDEIKRAQLDECRVWYIGDSNELLNYYTNQSAYGFAKNPIYNRNKGQYFWGISPTENSIKRVHSGIPHAIVDTLNAAIGVPEVSAIENGKLYDLSELVRRTQFRKIISQEQMPLTMAEGWGALKVVIYPDKKVSDWPTVQFYEAKDVEFVVKCGITVGIIYKDYYKKDGKDYLLVETRRINDEGNSAIEYELFRLKKNDEVEPVSLSEIPELSKLQDVEIKGYKKIFGVPCRFFFDPQNKDYGRSIFAGKIDLFDDLDQSLSQRSQTSRVSTPIEYYSPDVLERNGSGRPLMPKVYNRQFIMKPSIPDGDGKVDNDVQTTQPTLNFDQYTQEQRAILDFILTGLLSPATMGIDVSKKDNADAQREKEKVTIMTRNSIIESETEIVKSLVELIMVAKEYMDTGGIPLVGRDVSVKFSEFASPTFENMSKVLTPMLSQGAISPKMFVSKLYGDSLSKEEREEEQASLTARQSQDNMGLAEAMGHVEPE